MNNSSSHLTSNTERKKFYNLPKEWSHIDYSSLEKYGFDEVTLIEIHREYKNNAQLYLSADIIQDSINHFAFDLKNKDFTIEKNQKELNNFNKKAKFYTLGFITPIILYGVYLIIKKFG